MTCLGQGLSGGFYPVAAVLGQSEVFDTIPPGTHGSTYGGNPMACIVAIESIEQTIKNNLSQNAEKQGKFIKEELQKLQGEDNKILNVNGKGLLIGLTLNTSRINMSEALEDLKK